MPYTNYPGTWSNPNQPYMYPSAGAMQRSQGNLIWVNGFAGAKAYPTAPNTSVLLLDNSEPYAYLKITDAANFPTVERFRIDKDPIIESSESVPLYATHDEVALLSSKVDNLVALLEPKKEGVTDAQSNIQQSATATSYSESHNEQAGLVQSSNDGGYQGNIRPNAGQSSTEW